MAWFSILPEHLSSIETWLARVFLLLAIVTFGPWGALIIYDILLYIWRSLTYEIPYVGGRARGRVRPRAPSLTERPDGHRRRISIARPLSRGTYGPFASGSAIVEDEKDEAPRKRETGA